MIDERHARDLGIVEVGDQTHHARERLADRVEAGLVAVRAALAVAGDRAVDQFGVELRELRVIEAELLPGRRPEVFYEDIGGREQIEKNFLPLALAQVERDALLVAVERAKARAVAFVFRIAAPMRIALARQLDLDDFAPQVAEETAGVRTGDVPADVDGPCSVERTVDHFISRKAF